MMDSLVSAPTPGEENSGVSGEQQPGTSNEIVHTPPPLNGELMVQTMRNLIEVNPGQFGGIYAGPMLSAHLGDSHYDKGQARRQIADLQSQLAQVSEKLSEKKIENARLEERLANAVVRVWVQKFCAFCSPVAFSLAIDLNKASSNLWVITAFLGVALLAASVLPDQRKSDEH